MKTQPLYKRHLVYLQVGTKHVISTELQIFNIKHGGSISWFDDNNHMDTVISNIQGGLMYCIDCKDNDDAGLQIVEHDTLLLVYKFRKSPSKDSVIIHNDHVAGLGLSSHVADNWYNTLGNGDYTYLLLYPEKLIVSVALRNESEVLLDMTEASLVADTADGGGAGGHFANTRKATMSENRKKNTLKKIWSTRTRLSTEEAKKTDVEKENCDAALSVGEPSGSQITDVPSIEVTNSVDYVASFKKKKSVFEKEKNQRKCEPVGSVGSSGIPSGGKSVNKVDAERMAGETVAGSQRADVQLKLIDLKTKEAPLFRSVRRYPSNQLSNSQSSSSAIPPTISHGSKHVSFIEINDNDETQLEDEYPEQPKPPKHGTTKAKDTENSAPMESLNTGTSSSADAEISAPSRAQKRGVTKSMEEDFSDNEDFSKIKVKLLVKLRSCVRGQGERKRRKKILCHHLKMKP